MQRVARSESAARRRVVAVAAIVVMWVGSGVASASGPPRPPLPGPALHHLIVAPPPPFEVVPDDVLKTGLMEIGNPHSGTIGTVVTTKQLRRAKFQRGWESVFRADDGANALVDVFEFPNAADASEAAAEGQARIPSTYSPVPVDGLAFVAVYNGTSPDGRSVSSTIYSRGRFFVVQLLGGPPGAHDYAELLAGLAHQQVDSLDHVGNAS